MAAVYKGRDTALDREVAVKLLHPHLASSAEARARFSREARAVARLSHPSILEIFDYSGDDAPEAFLVTEFIRGRTLRAYAAEVGFGYPDVALLVGRALADALVHAHSAGVIHRDLKPENVLVQEAPRPAVKLADFGIARILASDERMTMTGALVGSPHHMAPEIIEGKEADARSDLFSLGTLLYWLATGRLPFAAANPTAILRRVLDGDYEDPRACDARVSDALAALVAQLLAVEPERRPPRAADVRDALDGQLAEVGVERPAEELAAFLADPAAYRAAFADRAVRVLVARGDAALRDGARARALNHYGRVLALAPGNAEVAAKLAALTRRFRIRRAAGFALLAAAIAGAGTAGAIALRRRPGDAHAPAVTAATSASPAPAAGAAPAIEPGAPAATGASGPAGSPPELPAVDEAAAAAPTPAAARPHPGPAVLSVLVRPYAQRALLDGVEVARGEQLVRFELTRGRLHVLQIEHACCAPFVKRLSAEEAESLGELRVPLEPRPARLRIEGDPATRVLVDGHLVGTAGDSQRAPFEVMVPAGGESPYEGTAAIALEPPEAPSRTVQVKLRAGGEVVVAVPETEVAP